jgi:hypothetical protein
MNENKEQPGMAGAARQGGDTSDESAPASALYGRLAEMENILREGSRWNGNDYDYAAKSESDVAMLVDLIADAFRLERATKTEGGEAAAWARKWHVDGEKPAKERNANGRMAWPHKFTFHAITPNKVFNDDVPLYAAPVPPLPAPAAPIAWKSLNDVQWMNIVNHDHAYERFSKEDAVHEAVKRTEAKLRELNAVPGTLVPSVAESINEQIEFQALLTDAMVAAKTGQNPTVVSEKVRALTDCIDAHSARQAQAAPQAVDGVHWDLFPGYLIDHCEGDTISEEGLQHRLSDMLLSANYKRIAAKRAAAQAAPATPAPAAPQAVQAQPDQSQRIAELERQVEIWKAEVDKAVAWLWRDGPPPFPQDQEWFIAETKHGKAVLRALPDEHTYDYTTADHTYIIRANIKRWAQFPDSEYIAPSSTEVRATAPEVRLSVDERTTAYHQGYQAGIEMGKALAADEAATPAAPAAQAQPSADVRDAALEDAKEGVQILDDLMENVERQGNYSQDTTLTFLGQIRQCFNGIDAVRLSSTPAAVGRPIDEKAGGLLERMYTRHKEWAERSGHAPMGWAEFQASRLENPLSARAIELDQNPDAAQYGVARTVSDSPTAVGAVRLDAEQYQNLRKLAFRTIWLGYAWNDHNFDHAHIEARTSCEAVGITSFDKGNAFLSALPEYVPPAKGAAGQEGGTPAEKGGAA